MLSGLKRKKFSAGVCSMTSCVAEAPLMKVASGTLLAKSRSATLSMPERGPTTMRAPCSISVRALAVTDAGVPSVDSTMVSMPSASTRSACFSAASS